MKLFLIITLLGLFVLFAFFIKNKYVLRNNFFKDLDAFCVSYINHINFLKTPIPELIDSTIQNYNYPFNECLSEYNEYLKKHTPHEFVFSNKIKLSNAEVQAVESIFKMLGRADVDTEINNVSNFKNLCQSFLENNNTKLKKEGEVYFKLCILLGICLSIMIA